MDTNSLLNEAKKALGIKSDYQLAKAIEMHSGLIADYRKGKRILDTYACGRLAEVLGLDALELIAQVEAESEKNATRAAWWSRFLSSLPRSAAMLVCGLSIWAGFSPAGGVQVAEAEVLNVRLRRMQPAMI